MNTINLVKAIYHLSQSLGALVGETAHIGAEAQDATAKLPATATKAKRLFTTLETVGLHAFNEWDKVKPVLYPVWDSGKEVVAAIRQKPYTPDELRILRARVQANQAKAEGSEPAEPAEPAEPQPAEPAEPAEPVEPVEPVEANPSVVEAGKAAS